jgi:hypothetical protein
MRKMMRGTTARRLSLATFLTLLAWSFQAIPTLAQASGCQDGQKLLADRQAIVARINKLGRKNVNPADACRLFGALANNGSAAVKWAQTNKDWCQIPDPFVAGLKADHTRSLTLRTQACKAAQQQAVMAKRAKESQASGNAQSGSGQNGGGGMLGGGGVTGEYRIPQGAL